MSCEIWRFPLISTVTLESFFRDKTLALYHWSCSRLIIYVGIRNFDAIWLWIILKDVNFRKMILLRVIKWVALVIPINLLIKIFYRAIIFVSINI